MAKNEAITKYTTDKCNRIKDVFYDMSAKEQQALNEALDNYVSGWSFTSFIDDLFNDFADIMDGESFEDDYEASTKKSKGESMNKSKYKDIQKRLNKIGGFTKEDDEPDVEVEIEVEDDEDEESEKPEVEVSEESEESEKGCKDCKSEKSIRTSKKRMKMKKGEDMPEDADDQQDQNEKGTGNAGSELPEEANDQQDINEKGSGNAGSELPEEANDQQDIKESARKTRKAMNRPPVRKFSVTNGGQPNQESYNGRYQQAPMVRNAIDGHMSSRANKSFDEIAMMNERIANLQKSKRNPSGNNGVPKRLH